jgi:hypothetical protein
MIADLVREDPECAPAIAELLREILPFSAALFVPPGWDERYVTGFGFTLEDLYAHGAEALEGRLRAAGLRPEEMRTGMDFSISPRERARRVLVLLRAGYLGEPGSPLHTNPEATELLFDGLRRQLDVSAAPGAVIQWDFRDAEPWHVRADPQGAVASAGRIEDPDLWLRCRFADWIEIASGRTPPWRLMLTGRLRIGGRLRVLARAPRLLGA